MFPDNQTDWYFVINGNQTQVYHTGRGIFVPLADAAYVTWLAKGTPATALPSIARLGEVLAPLFIRPTDATVLDAYVGVHADTVLSRPAFKVLYQHENRIRAIERALSLNGSPANLTPAQAKAAIKALL